MLRNRKRPQRNNTGASTMYEIGVIHLQDAVMFKKKDEACTELLRLIPQTNGLLELYTEQRFDEILERVYSNPHVGDERLKRIIAPLIRN